ncbi:MAG: acetolactate synthase small subunit [Myxococcota bacterium]|nr:acetolactate synthase small subunit [Myxococcota bacterium]
MKHVHTISLLVVDKPGVLVRIALTFARRGYNIDSLVVSPLPNTDFARMTIAASGEPSGLEQIVKQISKLVDVVRVIDHTGESAVQVELALVKVAVDSSTRARVLDIIREFKAEVLDESHGALVASVHGSDDRVNAFVKALPKSAIQEIVCSGKLLVARGRELT